MEIMSTQSFSSIKNLRLSIENCNFLPPTFLSYDVVDIDA